MKFQRGIRIVIALELIAFVVIVLLASTSMGKEKGLPEVAYRINTIETFEYQQVIIKVDIEELNRHRSKLNSLGKIVNHDNNNEDINDDQFGYNLTEREFELMTKLVQSEATGEPYLGKIAVANVVLARVESSDFPNTIEEVIYQNRQFSVVNDGRLHTTKVTESTIEAVTEALEQGTTVVEGSLYFMNREASDSKNVAWFDTLEKVAEIGGHEFFR